MTADVDRLARKLDELAARDTAYAVFGAEQHRYARVPAAEQALFDLEAAAGFALPEIYRLWMLRIGAGAGPAYGLWAPAAAMEQMRATPEGSGGQVRDPAAISPAH